MLGRLIPEGIKEKLRYRIRRIVEEGPKSGSPSYSPYYGSHSSSDEYVLRDVAAAPKFRSTGLPVPPVDLRVGYGPADDLEGVVYMECGERNVAEMSQVLRDSGFEISTAKRILDFGCASGRMLSHVSGVAPQAQCWGTDISAEHIRWCRHNLSPPMNFAVTTKIPHLPFRDRFFDLIYCGSVFTHIEDLEESWLLELGRILEPGGRLYVTIHDEHTVRLFDEGRPEPLAQQMMNTPTYFDNRHDFRMMVVGRDDMSLVFYHSDYFRSIIPPVFRWVSHTPAAYGYQSAVVLERTGD